MDYFMKKKLTQKLRNLKLQLLIIHNYEIIQTVPSYQQTAWKETLSLEEVNVRLFDIHPLFAYKLVWSTVEWDSLHTRQFWWTLYLLNW